MSGKQDAPDVAKAATKRARAPNRSSIKGVTISPDDRVSLYSVAHHLPEGFKEKAGLRICLSTYFKDPFIAETNPTEGIDDQALVDWEPNLTDGPTSARFAVVDYNADEQTLAAPAEWDEKQQTFVRGTTVLDGKDPSIVQFHQVNVWTLLQQTLALFEGPDALGRRIPWAFEGNRLIVVPHAGYGQNAYYDRESKSLQFYYFDDDGKTVYTCLSSDIVRHEFGHAVLDGVRPLFNESSQPQTGAFHEFFGDLTAILTTLLNTRLRRALADATGGKIDRATAVSEIAAEFGKAVSGKPYLRNVKSDKKMSDLAGVDEPHDLSEVLTATMFEILTCIGDQYQQAPANPGQKVESPKEAFKNAAERMWRMAMQPLDLLPPVEVNFRDYALAVCRAQRLADPIDPRGYYDMLIKIFVKRGILNSEDQADLEKKEYLFKRPSLSVPRNIDDISRSRGAAYRFLDDNREDLLIPATCDFSVADLYEARKQGRQGLPLPSQIILEYVWREEVLLEGARFGRYQGRITTMLCGGTLVFDETGNIQSWAMKPGSAPYGGKRNRQGATALRWNAAVNEGTARRTEQLENLARQIAQGNTGMIAGSDKGILGSMAAPILAEDDGDTVRFRLSPHLHLSQDESAHTGEREWEISC
jgi:hypothetical protein